MENRFKPLPDKQKSKVNRRAKYVVDLIEKAITHMRDIEDIASVESVENHISHDVVKSLYDARMNIDIIFNRTKI